MLKFEIKKVFSRTVNKIALVIIAAMLFIVSYLAISSIEYVDENGVHSSGIAAARTLKKEKNQWAGLLTADVLSNVIVKNGEINASPEYLSKDINENNKAYAKKQGFSDIRTMINQGFSPFMTFDYYRADSVGTEEVRNLYEQRTAGLAKWLQNEGSEKYSEAEKNFLITSYQELKTPFYYEYSDGWKALLEYSLMIIMLLVLVMGFLVSGIFSNEFQLKSDSIFFSTKLGRNKAVRSKIGAGFLIVTVIYWSTMLLYSAIVLLSLGMGGGACPIQSSLGGWRSFYNITFLQEYLLVIFGGYLGNLFILTLSMFISAKSHSTVLAVTIPFIFLFIPTFLSDISALSNVLGLLPDQLLQINEIIGKLNLYQIGGKVIGAIPLLLILYSVLYLALLPMLYHVYKRAEVN